MSEGYSNRVKPDQFKEWNEGMIRKYDPDAFHHHPNPLVRWVERKRVKTIFALMKIQEEDRLLEVGCGAGNILEKAPRANLYGIDLSPFILAKARQKLRGTADLFQGDAEKLPFKDGSFGQVICSEVLEHLMDPTAALNEIARVLKPQGVAVVSVPNERWINRMKEILIRLGIFRWLLHRQGEYGEMPERMEDEWHLHAFSLKKWGALFGIFFKVTCLKRIPFFWLPLRYVIQLERVRWKK